MIAFALLLMAAEPASSVDVSGDVVVTISVDGARELSGDVDLAQEGKTLLVKAKRGGNASVAFGAPKVEKLIVRDGARVTLSGFAGRSLSIVASGGAVVVVTGKGTSSLVIDGSGTSRVDTDALAAESADVTLKDAARASIKATKRLSCDLKRASRLVVTGKPGSVEKKLAGVAKLELK